MAKFKSPSPKETRYVFNFLENRKDKKPAAVIFKRFPLPGEDFMPDVKSSVFEGLDFTKIGAKDEQELQKFTSRFMQHFRSNVTKVDYEYFLRECVEKFENFECDGANIETVDDFLKLNPYMTTLIADDCYNYAQEKEEFTMGE